MSHRCHASGCATEVKPELLMCLRHWRMVTPSSQKAVWAAYRQGQCDDMNPSIDWLIAATKAQMEVAAREGKVATVKRYAVELEQWVARREREKSDQKSLEGIR